VIPRLQQAISRRDSLTDLVAGDDSLHENHQFGAHDQDDTAPMSMAQLLGEFSDRCD
jgi:hypothetical protein